MKRVEERSPEKAKKRKMTIAEQQREEKMKALMSAENSTDECSDSFALKTKGNWYEELNSYDANPLHWFRDNEKDYGALAVYAKRIFSFPA